MFVLAIKKIVSDESGLTVAVETILLFGISIIFLGMIFMTFQGFVQNQGKILMQENFMSVGQSIAKKMTDMNMEARASLSAGANTSIKSEFRIPSKIADNTYSVKLQDGKILVESTSGPYVSVEVPLSSDIIIAENSTIYSFDETFRLEYDSSSGSIFFADGGVTPYPDYNSPTLEIVSPPEGATLSGTSKINVSVWDDVIVTRVEYYVNGIYNYTAGSDHNWSWNTKTMPDGTYNVTVIAYDGAGNSKPASRSYNISNVITDPPVITPISPLSTTDFRKPTIEAQISDDQGIDFSSIILKVDGINRTSNATLTIVNSRLATIKYIPAENLALTSHSVNMTVKDISNQETPGNWSFSITNITDTDKPAISINNPVNGTFPSPGSSINIMYTVSDGTSGLDNLTINVTYDGGNLPLHIEALSIYPIVAYGPLTETWPSGNTYLSGKNYIIRMTVYDRNGNSANATVGPLSVSLDQASELDVDTSGKTLTPGNKTLDNIMLKDNISNSVNPIITKITVSWIPNSTEKITQVYFNGITKWKSTGSYVPSGSRSSGTKLTVKNKYTVTSSIPLKLIFDSDMFDKDFTILFEMDDGSKKTVTFST